jgi:hypothetical protein
MRKTNKENTRWTDGKGTIFLLKAIYSPNEEQDPWAEYINIKTTQSYTCRLEAFEHRFSLLVE